MGQWCWSLSSFIGDGADQRNQKPGLHSTGLEWVGPGGTEPGEEGRDYWLKAQGHELKLRFKNLSKAQIQQWLTEVQIKTPEEEEERREMTRSQVNIWEIKRSKEDWGSLRLSDCPRLPSYQLASLDASIDSYLERPIICLLFLLRQNSITD